jgi:hypothetical protein
MTTRRATYANTSDTPVPVLAEVKNNLGPRGGRGGVACARACLDAYRAGVMVGADEVDMVEVERER